MKRRSALQLGGTTLVSFLSGCSVFRTTAPSVVSVSAITIRNRLDREIEVSVLLIDKEEGEVAYWQLVRVPVDPNPFATVEDLPETGGAYELYAHIPAVDDDPPVEANLVEAAGDHSCITVGMDVTTARVDGGDLPAVAYGTIGEC